MLLRALLTTSLLGSLLSVNSHAQTLSVSSRYYIGASVSLLTNVPFTSGGAPRLVGPSVTAGIQFSPRLSSQAGVAYYRKSETYPLYFYGQGTAGGYTLTNLYQYFSAPVLLRYRLNSTAKRFHIDGLAGATVLFGLYQHSSAGTPSPYYFPINYDYQTDTTKICLTLGPAVRYTLSSHVELTADGLISAELGHVSSFSNRLFLNVLLGIRYTFGKHYTAVR